MEEVSNGRIGLNLGGSNCSCKVQVDRVEKGKHNGTDGGTHF